MKIQSNIRKLELKKRDRVEVVYPSSRDRRGHEVTLRLTDQQNEVFRVPACFRFPFGVFQRVRILE